MRHSGLCGVDEAGRGPLAGPVYAAAVILDPRRPIDGLADSKTLSEKKRRRLDRDIRERAHAWAIATASVEEIDRLNILHASLLAMARAVEALAMRDVPGEILIDGLHLPPLAFEVPMRALVGGDRLVAEISAASILAKNARDDDMIAACDRYPGYGFSRHKGYGTRAHLDALQALGPCPLHRMSFAPVRAAVRKESS